MLAILDKKTQKLAVINVAGSIDALIHDQKFIGNLSKEDIADCIPIYRLLHYFPVEYLPRSSRVDLAMRALAADVLTKSFESKEEPLLEHVTEWRATCRSFLVKVVRETQAKAFEDVVFSALFVFHLTIHENAPSY